MPGADSAGPAPSPPASAGGAPRIHPALYAAVPLAAVAVAVFIRRALTSQPGFYEEFGTSVAVSVKAVLTAMLIGVMAYRAAGLLPTVRSRWGSVVLHGAAVLLLFAVYVGLQLLWDRVAYASGLFPASASRFELELSGLAVRHASSGFEVGMLALATGYALRRWPRAGALELADNQVRGEVARLEVELLRAQLHPHFLFNALNSISALTYLDPARAGTMLVHLSRLVRRTAAQSPEQVSLERELAVVRDYVALEQMRFGSRIQLRVDVEPAALPARVPNLLLQPLVENAIRHGAAPCDHPVTLLVSARVIHGATLVLDVSDDGAGLQPGARGAGSGTGTANTIARLRLRYGAGASFDLAPREGGGTRATVVLPLRLSRMP